MLRASCSQCFLYFAGRAAKEGNAHTVPAASDATDAPAAAAAAAAGHADATSPPSLRWTPDFRSTA